MKKLMILFFVLILLVPFIFAQDSLSRGPGGPILFNIEGRQASTSLKFISNPLTYLAIIITILYIVNYRKTKKHNPFLILVIGLPIFILISPSNIRTDISKESNLNWKENYKLQTSNIDRKYFEETSIFDYSSESVKRVVDNIDKLAINEYDAIQKVLDYVYINVPYNYYETDAVCFNANASQVIETKTGQCDTQSIAVIAILRGLGFATRPVGGCVYKNKLCLTTQSVLFPKLREPILPVRPDDYYGRGQIIDDLSRRGTLHAWPEVYIPEKGWITLEATAGEIIYESCYVYNVELYPDNIIDLCVTKNPSYATWCRQQ